MQKCPFAPPPKKKLVPVGNGTQIDSKLGAGPLCVPVVDQTPKCPQNEAQGPQHWAQIQQKMLKYLRKCTQNVWTNLAAP